MKTQESSRVVSIKRRLSRLTSQELGQVRRYLDARMKAVSAREWQVKVEAAWVEMKELNLQYGDLLFNHQSGTTLARTWQRGDCGAVYAIQPKKRLVWVDTEYGWVAVTPNVWACDRISPELPTSFISEYERRVMAGVGRAINESLDE